MSTTSPLILGIDLSKDWLDAYLLPSGQSWHVNSDPDSLAEWVRQLPDGINLAVMEASGGIQRLPAAILAEANIPISIVNPKKVRDFAKAMGQLAKTDAIDAKMIAEFGEKVQPQPRRLPDEAQSLLTGLVARRTQVMRIRTGEQNRLRTVHEKSIRRSIQAHIEWLKQEEESIDEQIEQLVQSKPKWAAQQKLMTSIPGVGVKTANALLARMSEMGCSARRGVTALAGLAPFARDSGKSYGNRFVHGGRKHVREALYMAALAAIRHNPPLRVFYQQLVERGKPKKVALTAVMRRLLVIINAIVRDETPWCESKVNP